MFLIWLKFVINLVENSFIKRFLFKILVTIRFNRKHLIVLKGKHREKRIRSGSSEEK